MTNTSSITPTTFSSPFAEVETRLGRDAFSAGEFAIIVGDDPVERSTQVVKAAARAVKACEEAGAGIVLFACATVDISFIVHLFRQEGIDQSTHLRVHTAQSASGLALLLRTASRGGRQPAAVFVESLSAMCDPQEAAAGAWGSILAQTLVRVAHGDLDSAFEKSSGLPLSAINDVAGSAPLEPVPVVAGLRCNRLGEPWGSKDIRALASLIYRTDGRLYKASI
jgi:hypothetical protein